VDPKSTKTNKHKLVVASQDDKLRAYMRMIPGVPLIYLKRSVMVMEPMAAATEKVREAEERGKFRAGLKGSRISGNASPGSGLLKRKRDNDDDEEAEDSQDGNADSQTEHTPKVGKKRRRKGPSGPNPLSAKKSSKKLAHTPSSSANGATGMVKNTSDATQKAKRRRKHTSGNTNGADNAAEPPRPDTS